MQIIIEIADDGITTVTIDGSAEQYDTTDAALGAIESMISPESTESAMWAEESKARGKPKMAMEI